LTVFRAYIPPTVAQGTAKSGSLDPYCSFNRQFRWNSSLPQALRCLSNRRGATDVCAGSLVMPSCHFSFFMRAGNSGRFRSGVGKAISWGCISRHGRLIPLQVRANRDSNERAFGGRLRFVIGAPANSRTASKSENHMTVQQSRALGRRTLSRAFEASPLPNDLNALTPQMAHP
jgi:hypothetical protein